MTIVQCPGCQSRFRVEKAALPEKTVKMRCSVCSRVFFYSPADEAVIEQDFATIIGTQDSRLEEMASQTSTAEEFIEGISESMKEEASDEKGPAEAEVQPESVIREIDSILGSGEEVSGEDGQESKKRSGNGSTLKMIVAVALIVLIFLGIGLWIMKDSLPFFRQAPEELNQALLERGPFFSIPDDSVTYELLANNNEGSVLVVKGIVKKLTPKPVKSVLVQARVYDRSNSLIESRSAYAGIIPDSAEFVRQRGSDIVALLSAEPRTLGALATSPDIPFAVAFFGRPAQEGFSFQVEVKEFHWK